MSFFLIFLFSLPLHLYLDRHLKAAGQTKNLRGCSVARTRRGFVGLALRTASFDAPSSYCSSHSSRAELTLALRELKADRCPS